MAAFGINASVGINASIGLNAAFSAATSLLGIRNDPYKAYNFLIEIEGLLVGGFSEVTGLFDGY